MVLTRSTELTVGSRPGGSKISAMVIVPAAARAGANGSAARLVAASSVLRVSIGPFPPGRLPASSKSTGGACQKRQVWQVCIAVSAKHADVQLVACVVAGIARRTAAGGLPHRRGGGGQRLDVARVLEPRPRCLGGQPPGGRGRAWIRLRVVRTAPPRRSVDRGGRAGDQAHRARAARGG